MIPATISAPLYARIIRDGKASDVLEALVVIEDTLREQQTDEDEIREVEGKWLEIQYLRDLLSDLEQRLDRARALGEDPSLLRSAARNARNNLQDAIEHVVSDWT